MRKVGDLLVNISTNVATIKRDFDHVQRNIKGFADKTKKIMKNVAIAIASAFAVRAIINFTKKTLDAIDRMEELAQMAGMEIEQFQGFAYAAEFATVSTDQLQKGIKTLSAYMLDASLVGGSYARYFNEIGISVTDAKGKLKDTGDVVLELADKFSQMADGTKKTALASRLMGRAGAQLIPMLNMGADALRELIEENKRFGMSISADVARKISIVTDNMLKMKKNVLGIWWGVVAGMSGSLFKLTNALLGLRKETENFEGIGDKLGMVLEVMAKGAILTAGAFDLLGTAVGGFWGSISMIGSDHFMDTVNAVSDDLKKTFDDYKAMLDAISKAPGTPPPLSTGKGAGGTDEAPGTEQKINRINEIIKLHQDDLAIIEAYTASQKLNLGITNDTLMKAKQVKGNLELQIKEYDVIIQKAGDIRRATEEEKASFAKLNEVAYKLKLELKEQENIIDSYSSAWLGIKNGLTKYVDEAKNLGKQVEEVVTNSLKGMEDALVDFVTTGKMDFKSLVDSMISDLARLAIRQAVMVPFAGMFGLAFHQGGMVGMGGTPRMIPARAYASAPRYHTGLRANEIPAILERGEEVIPKEQAGRHLSINVPFTVVERNPSMQSDLRQSIENTVLDVIRKYA